MPSDGRETAPRATVRPVSVDAESSTVCPLNTSPGSSQPSYVQLTTDSVEAHRRFDFWVGAISEVMFPITSTTPEPGRFSSRMTVARLEEMVFLRIEGSARHSVRSRLGISRSDSRSFHLVGDFRAPSVVEWRGECLHLSPGDLVLMDSQEMHGVRYSGGMDAVNLRVPPVWARAWLRDPESLVGQRISAAAGWGAALSNFLCELKPQVIAKAPLPRKVLGDNVGALLALAEADLTGRDVLRPVGHRQLIDKIDDLMRQRAPEHGLTAGDVAATLGLSERTLHRSLAAASTTFSQLLVQIRIEIARRMLAAGNLKRLSTAEIGSRAGFSDPSHFVRVATRHLGTTPAKFRAASRAESSTD